MYFYDLKSILFSIYLLVYLFIYLFIYIVQVQQIMFMTESILHLAEAEGAVNVKAMFSLFFQ